MRACWAGWPSETAAAASEVLRHPPRTARVRGLTPAELNDDEGIRRRRVHRIGNRRPPSSMCVRQRAAAEADAALWASIGQATLMSSPSMKL